MKQLIKEAIIARQSAYVPYSKFQVGAALLLNDGRVVHGANIENASYGLCNCAERSALFSHYSQGGSKQDIKAFAVVADTDKAVSPCGACRQVMVELMPLNTPIYLGNLHEDIKETSPIELLPYAFLEVENNG